MSNAVAVITEAGFGKSTAFSRITQDDLKRGGIEHEHIGLNPKETLLINVKGKPLPYRGWTKDYIQIDIAAGPPEKENYLVTTDHQEIIRVMQFFNNNRPDIKNIVIDDSQYLMAEEFMQNALKSGFEKFSRMAKNIYDVINTGMRLRSNINFYMMAHVEEVDGRFRMKTLGKLLAEKVTVEGLFTIVLYGKAGFDSTTKKPSRLFVTNYDGEYPAKSPIGMFESLYIPNDLGLVNRAINQYYE